MANEKKTYLVATSNGDWQELGDAGLGATIWDSVDRYYGGTGLGPMMVVA